MINLENLEILNNKIYKQIKNYLNKINVNMSEINIIANSNKTDIVKRHKLKGGYSGTGDIMASIVSAMAVRGIDIETAVNTAADFISKAVYDTSLENTDVNDGVVFEKFLGDLTKI